MNRIKSTAQYMCRWIFVECKYIKYRIRTDILRQPDRYIKINSVLITQDMVNEDGNINKEIYEPRNLDAEIREDRDNEKRGERFKRMVRKLMT
jgi:hypothetical protein